MKPTGNKNKQKENPTENAGQKETFSRLLIAFIVTAGFATALYAISIASDNQPNEDNSSIKNPSSVSDLILLSEDQLANIDIAKVNLICAQGLQGSENLNIDQCMSILDDWAEQARIDMEKRLPYFSQYSAKYDNSVILYKIVNMILFLKNTIGVNYNLDIMKSRDFLDSKDHFIHGCLTGKKEGGCVSIPITCVAVGRRLGYPLKLVTTREHVFFRWDDGKEVINFEACCRGGCDSHPDSYYKSFPARVSEAEIKDNHYLKSLTPKDELALFLETRGHLLADTGNKNEAQIMFAYANNLMPTLNRQKCIFVIAREEIFKYKPELRK